MSAPERDSQPPQAHAAPGRIKRLAAAPRAAARWIRQKPRVRLPLVLAPLAILAGLGVGWGMWRSSPVEEAPTLEQLIAALEEENFARAQELANQLTNAAQAPHPPQGLSLFVRGSRLGHEATGHLEHRERRELHRLAAGYLRQALDQGLPEELWGQAILTAATHLNQAGQYTASIQLLEDGLAAGLAPAPEIDRLLAIAYSRTPNPQWAQALQHADRYLADQTNSPAARRTALLERAEILLGLNREDEAQAALDALGDDNSNASPAALVLRARLLVRQAQRLRGGALNETAEALPEGVAAALDEAMRRIEQVKSSAEINRPERRRADYLEGVCLRESGDLPAALEVFSKARRLHFGHPSGLAAALAEAELLQHLDRHDEALAAFHGLLAETPLPNDFSNPWISLDGFQARLLAAHARWLGQQRYEEALSLARALPPLFAADRALQLQAEVRTEWARRLMTQAESLPTAAAQKKTAEARTQYRLAGVSYAQVALLRRASRDYSDALWRSAENYLLGRDYRHAARLLRFYLEQDLAARRAEAHLYLGEAYLSLGALDQALAMFRVVFEKHPRHPVIYRVRILAAQSQLENGETAAAKTILRENLENESLAPQSLEWRDSLFLLGETLYREGVVLEAESRKLGADSRDPETSKPGLEKLQLAVERCREAARVLDEALRRYPHAPQSLRAWYYLAESHREAAKSPRKLLPLLALEGTRAAAEREMRNELTQAVAAYEQLIDGLTVREKNEELAGDSTEGLTDVEQAMLRNAYIGRADALFDLERYDEAIRAYTLAANRYQNEPVALEAFVQIASCHRRLRRNVEAQGVLEQAKVVLARIAPDADFQRTTRYGREQWEELLDLLTTQWQ